MTRDTDRHARNGEEGRPADGVGLRELKRRATENAIETAAVGLALAEGPDAVTVERICTEAFVSRSTFFNYFPSRDAAIYGRPIELDAGPEVDAILDEWPHALPIGLALAVLERIGADHINSAVAQSRLELVRRYPEIGSRLNWEVRAVRRSIEAVVVDWLERRPERIRLGEARHDAAIIVDIAMLLGEELYATWAAKEGDDPFSLESLEGCYRTVLERLEAYTLVRQNG